MADSDGEDQNQNGAEAEAAPPEPAPASAFAGGAGGAGAAAAKAAKKTKGGGRKITNDDFIAIMAEGQLEAEAAAAEEARAARWAVVLAWLKGTPGTGSAITKMFGELDADQSGDALSLPPRFQPSSALHVRGLRPSLP